MPAIYPLTRPVRQTLRTTYIVFMAIVSISSTTAGSAVATFYDDSTPIVKDRLNLPLAPSAINYIEQAQQQKLAQSRGWLRLLYYPESTFNGITGRNNIKSRVNNPRFFVSDNGNTDPQAELSATLTALLQQNQHTTLPSEAVACRFPARVHWIMQQLKIPATEVPLLKCPEFEKWRQDFTPSAVSLVFAQEYLDSPASAFGHSFLRFDSATTGQAKILNYMPKTIPNEPFLKFSYKSIIAGNIGEFTLEPYEQKIASYRDQEGRDIWRYPLNLTLEEREQLARIIWEIKEQNLTYLLTKDNCASEILALLNILHPDKNYLKHYHTIVAPADIVRSLSRQNMLIGNPIYEPSKKSLHQAELNRSSVTNVATHSLPETTSSPRSLIPANNNPLSAQALSRISLGIGQQHHKNFTELGYRLVYHDALDGQAGYPVGFYLEGLSAKLRYFSQPISNKDNQLQLENFTLLKARSLHPINTANNGISWGGHLGLERIIASDKTGVSSHLVGRLGAEYGWSIAYGKPSANSVQLPPNLCYALATGDIQVGKGLAHDNRLGVGTILGCIHQLGSNWRALTEIKLPYWYEAGHEGGNGYWQPNATIGIQYDLSRQQSLRLSGQYLWQPATRNPSATTENFTPNSNTSQMLLQYLHYF